MKAKYSLDREKVLAEAYERCMEELYNKAQPSGSFKKYIKKIKAGEITKQDQKKNPIYDRHYLSHEEAKYIVEKYIKAYRIGEEFKSDCDVLLNDMKQTVPVDKYIDEVTDEHGNYHPGHRGYEDRPPMKERLVSKLTELGINSENIDKDAEELSNFFESFIKERRDFYRFDRDSEKFNNSIWLGAVPTSNKTAVINYWKEQGKNINIIDRDPERFWYYDNGWTDKEIDDELNYSNNPTI